MKGDEQRERWRVPRHDPARRNISGAERERPRFKRKKRFGWVSLGVLCLLLVCPVWALSSLLHWVDWRIALWVMGTIWAVTYVSYHGDKRNAEAGKWRIPEATLHLWEILGGWPAAF